MASFSARCRPHHLALGLAGIVIAAWTLREPAAAPCAATTSVPSGNDAVTVLTFAEKAAATIPPPPPPQQQQQQQSDSLRPRPSPPLPPPVDAPPPPGNELTALHRAA
jgi:hypothetical protein